MSPRPLLRLGGEATASPINSSGKRSSLKEQQEAKESWPEQRQTFQIFSDLWMIKQTRYLDWEDQITKSLTLLLCVLFPVDRQSRWSYWFLLAL